jgi:arylsulfatase A-like enzyme
MLRKSLWTTLRGCACLLAGALAFAGLAAAVGAPTNSPPQPRRPSILLIVADDLGYGDLGCYGQTRIKTPNLDKMAAEGVRFTSFYAGSTVCAPSRCSLMTGLNTGHATIRGNSKQALRLEDQTIAQLLKEANYHTTVIGKWGLGNEGSTGLPQNKGFDECFGYLDQTLAHDYYPDHLYHYVGKTKNSPGFEGQQFLYDNADNKRQLYSHDLFTRSAINFIRNHRPTKENHYQPFFLYLAYTIPHANNEEGRQTGNGMQVPSDEPYSSEPWPQVERNKAAMITRLDRDVGQILEALKKQNAEENTIVIFTSDNGPHKEGGVDPKFFNSSGPLRGIKRDLYEGGIRVPMIVRWPFGITSPRVCDVPWAFWDIMPTATDIARIAPPSKTDGISFFPTLLGQAQTNQHSFLYWEFHEKGFHQAARMGDWKAVRNGLSAPLELYNLKNDLGETNNVARDNAAVVAEFAARLKSARTDSAEWPVSAATDSNAPSEGKLNE